VKRDLDWQWSFLIPKCGIGGRKDFLLLDLPDNKRFIYPWEKSVA